MFNIFEVLREVKFDLLTNIFQIRRLVFKKNRIHPLNNFAILVLLNCERNHGALILQTWHLQKRTVIGGVL